MLLQEIELWYVIPALRNELASALKSYGLSQKKIAEILKVSPAAVSQYGSKKRGKDIDWDNDMKKLIRECASRLTYNPNDFRKEITQLTDAARKSRFICVVHKLFEKGLKPNCSECFLGEKDE